MKLIKKTRLLYQEGNSDKVYEVDLCELASRKDARYLVNFRYGRRGSTLREGSKTNGPVDLATAEKLFDSVVVSKTNKGYWDESSQPAKTVESPSPSPEPDNADDVQSRVDKLVEVLGKTSSSKKRGRIIWRLAELATPSIGSVLSQQIKKGDWLEDYAVIWALGRLKAVDQLDVVAKQKNSQHPQVRNIAIEVELLLSADSQKRALLASALSSLPEAMANAAERGDYAETTELLAAETKSLRGKGKVDVNELLIQCYRLSLVYPSIRKALLVCLETLPFRPGSFRGVRSIFKTAELRLDGPVFGLLSRRFETTKAYFRNDYDWTWLQDGGSVKPSKELKKPDSKLAYSHRTRDYLRRRSWRSIKRLGTAGDDRYVDMATDILLAISDDHGVEPRISETYSWGTRENGWRRELIARRQFDHLAAFVGFNHILFASSAVYQPLPSGKAWFKNEGAADNTRTESFPELWDKKLDNALRLLMQSQCASVHTFAARVLESHPAFCESINAESLTILLSSAYPSTCQFALQIVRQRIENQGVDNSLLLALLKSNLDEARALGIEQLEKTALDKSDFQWLASLLLVPYEDVQSVVATLVGKLSFTSSQQATLLEVLIEKVLTHSDTLSEELIVSLSSFALESLTYAVSQASLADIEKLVSSDDLAKQLFGARLLEGHRVAFNDIPESLLQAIHHSSFESVRGVGAALIGKQNDRELIEQLPLLVGLFETGEASERAAMLKLLARLADQSRWADKILQALMGSAFKSERYEGQHEALVDFVASHLQPSLDGLDAAVVWRLLQAQSKAAQQIGAMALASRKADDYSVKQWALMGRHGDVSVRQYAFVAFEKNVEKVKRHARDALLIVDNAWEDASEFGFNFFREQFGENDWDPQTIIFLCDSVNEQVQSFGRELLQQFFKEENGEEYLLKLSQHPSANVQLFVSNFLQDYAADQPDHILTLRRYFITVLSQVNKGRLCKDRIFNFLMQEAEKNTDVAQMATQLFTQLSLTVVHKDKAVVIQAMLKLQTLYPSLVMPLSQKQPTVKPVCIAGAAV